MAERLRDVMTSVAYNDLLGNSNILQFCCLLGCFLMLLAMKLHWKLTLYK